MRTLMALLTLGAGGVGYAYLQQTTVSDHSGSKPAPVRSLIDSSFATSSKADSSRGSVKELVTQIHEHTKSILDDFVSQHGGHSDAPTDNAFQRLKQVTESADRSFGDRAPAQGGTVSPSLSSRTLPSRLDELQRAAFDPVADLSGKSESLDEPGTTSRDSASRDTTAPIRVVAGNLEPTSKNGPRDSNRNRNAASVKPETSRITGMELKPKSLRMADASGATAKPAALEWKVIGKTTERRPMHSLRLGASGTRTLVIAGLDGQDRVAVRWLEQFAETVARRADLLGSNEVLFVRAGNPDGLVRKTKENARGVPLNRNFPSRNTRPAFGVPSFATPASEIETRVMLDTLYSFRPQRVVHLTSTTARSQVLYNKLAKDAASELERSASLRIVPLDPEQSIGSLECFADGMLESMVLSIKLNVGADWQQTWTSLEPQILSAVLERSVEAGENKSGVNQDPDRTPLPLPLPNVEPISRRPGRKGYEELPPPPET